MAMTYVFCSQTIFQKVLKVAGVGPCVPMYALGVHALGSGRAREAQGWFRRTLSVEERTLGADDATLAVTLHQMARGAFQAGHTEEAELLHLRALGIRESTQGHDHPDVARTLHALGLCVLKAGRTDEAKGYLRRALRIYSDKLDAKDVTFDDERWAFDTMQPIHWRAHLHLCD